MTKFKFDSVDQFQKYIQKWFSKKRNLNPEGYDHIIKNIDKKNGVAFLTFSTSARGRVLACAVKIKSKDVWLGFLPTFEHKALSEVPERLQRVHNHNHKINSEKHLTLQKELERSDVK